MIKRLTLLLIAVGVLCVALAAGVSYAGFTDIYGSAHDTGSPGSPTCQQCHVPHNALAPYLWAKPPVVGMSGLQALCLGCHDDTIAKKWFIGNPSYKSHDVNPGIAGQDCDRCHEPHQGDNWKFTADTIPVGYRNANLCSLCHNTGFSHPQNQLTDVPQDRTWDPYASPPDFSGTQLWDSAGTSVVSTGDGYIKCGTCHVPHAALADTELNTMALDGAQGREPICDNCHE